MVHGYTTRPVLIFTFRLSVVRNGVTGGDRGVDKVRSGSETNTVSDRELLLKTRTVLPGDVPKDVLLGLSSYPFFSVTRESANSS